jgi:soluble lytic murein transglycosylase-like protein
MPMPLAVVTFVLALAAAVPAEAQIYTWRDAAGHLVLSDRPRTGASGAVDTYPVRGSASLRTTTRPAVIPASSEYDDLIAEHARLHRLPPTLVRAVIQAESGFNRYAVSRKGAMGLMQLMPATARELGVSDPFRPAENIRGGVTYLAGLIARYRGKLELALAAYNAGPARVEQYGAVPPYRETRDYVDKVTRAAGPVRPPGTVIYKWIEVVGGRPIKRYSNIPPAGVVYEISATR